jgi:hypothetical protein
MNWKDVEESDTIPPLPSRNCGKTTDGKKKRQLVCWPILEARIIPKTKQRVLTTKPQHLDRYEVCL